MLQTELNLKLSFGPKVFHDIISLFLGDGGNILGNGGKIGGIGGGKLGGELGGGQSVGKKCEEPTY